MQNFSKFGVIEETNKKISYNTIMVKPCIHFCYFIEIINVTSLLHPLCNKNKGHTILLIIYFVIIYY